MQHQIFTVYDTKVLAYLPPFYMQTKPAAIRAITDTMQDPSHQFSKHPEDYVLFHLGDFDDNTAAIIPLKVPLALAGLHELVPQEK